MAIASLFGPTPQQLLMARQKEAQEQQMLRNQQIAQQGGQFGVFAPLYQAGLRFGDVASQAAMQGLFPQQMDPALQQASAVQSVLGKYQGQDLSSPETLTKIGRDLMQVAPDAGLRALTLAGSLTKEKKTVTLSPGQQVIDPTTGKVLFSAPDKDEKKTVTVNPGQSIVNPTTGEVVYTAPEKAGKSENKVLPPGSVLVDNEGNVIAEGRATRAEESPEMRRYNELVRMGETPERARSIAYKTLGTELRETLAAERKEDKKRSLMERQESTISAIDNVVNKVDETIKQVGPFSAGAGSLLSVIPGTAAKNLAANVETIKANLGFDRLQRMRDASPTGGALGQVAVQELVALQASIASLDTAQSPAQLLANLNNVKRHYENWRATVRRAQEQDTEVSAGQTTPSVQQAAPQSRALPQGVTVRKVQ